MATEAELFAEIESYQPPTLMPGAIPAGREQEYVDLAAKTYALGEQYKQQQAAIQASEQAQAAGLFGAQGLAFGVPKRGAALLESILPETILGVPLGSGKSYTETLAEKQAMYDYLQNKYPGTAIASEIATGVAAPVGLTLKAGKAGIAALSPLARTALGFSAEAAPTAVQLARMGAVPSAIYGGLTARPDEVASSAVKAGVVGGALTAGLGKALQAGTTFLGSRAAEAGVSGETGALFPKGPQYTPAEIDLARILAKADVERLPAAKQALIEAGQTAQPLFIPEAVGSPSLYLKAKSIATAPAGREIAGTAIEQRTAATLDRLQSTLGRISTVDDPFLGSRALTEAGADLMKDLTKQRSEAVRELYAQAFKEAPVVESETLTKLIAKDKNLSSAINKAKSFAAYADQPDTSIEVLHHAKQLLDDSIAAAGPREARLLKETQKALVDEIESAAPTYKIAKDTFADLSKNLNRIEQSKINFLATLDPEDANKIGRVFELPTSVIESLRDDYVAAGKLPEWEAGIRAYLQNNIDKVADERNPISKLIGSVGQRKRLKAALGDKFDVVVKDLEIEKQIARGTKEYFAGSPTAPLLQQERANEAARTRLARLLTSPIQTTKQFAFDVLSATPSEQYYEDYARLLFGGTEPGLETLQRISPLVESLAKTRQVGETVARTTGLVAPRVSPTLQERANVPSPKKQLAIGGAALGISEADLLKEIEAFQPTQNAEKPAESIKVGKQDVSIPVGEQYAPPALVKAVMRVESAGKPKAVSEKGAAGLMQLMPGTAKDLGVEDRFDPAQNIEGGSRYLQQMINKYKKTDLALAAYNWGPSNIDKAIRKVKAEGKRVTWANIMQVVKVPMETRLYVNKVLKNKEVEAQEHNALGIWQLHKR